MIKDQVSIMKVGKMKYTKTEEFESEELSLGMMTKSNECSLKLFDMVESFALVKYGFKGFT